MITMYVDGGQIRALDLFKTNSKPADRKDLIVSWGIIAHYNDTSVELSGVKRVPQSVNAYHEVFAFIEAVIYAYSHGFDASQIICYTDDELTGYSNYHIHVGNYSPRRQSLIDRTKFICDQFYTEDVFDMVMKCYHDSHMVKVKGHDKTIYNLRCDYLANYARRSLKPVHVTMKSFESWIDEGFITYLDCNTVTKWFAPFANNESFK